MRCLVYKQFWSDFPYFPYTNIWNDVRSQQDRIYVVQTVEKVIQRCVLMATDPGDLVLDPTCGSGTTATVAEQWGRRWITIDTSRVAWRSPARLMSARYPYYLLADSNEGRKKEQERSPAASSPARRHKDIRQGFVYERAPHITLKSIANNAEIDVIWDSGSAPSSRCAPGSTQALDQSWEEWQIPRESEEHGRRRHGSFTPNGGRRASSGRRRSTTRSPKRRRRVPLRPPLRGQVARARRRAVHGREPVAAPGGAAREEDESPTSLPPSKARSSAGGPSAGTPPDFAEMVLEHLRNRRRPAAGQGRRISFPRSSWLARQYRRRGPLHRRRDGRERRAGIFIGPEFGTVSRADSTAAAREASDARFDVLIACAFNFDAHASELNRLGPLPILKAQDESRPAHGRGAEEHRQGQSVRRVRRARHRHRSSATDGEIQVKVNGIDVFDPATGDIRSATPRASPLVHRHRLQRGKLLRPPRLLPRRQRPLQEPEDGAEGRDRRGSLGDPLHRHLPPVPAAGERADRGEGDQPFRR
jgi:adenine-specific DNA-methyltransferase